jgi:hypothetical protein
MTPKILALTNKTTGQTVLVNPFRVNRWAAVTPPTQQPHLAGKLGTEVVFTGRDRLFVVETLETINRMIQGLKPLKGRAKKDHPDQLQLLSA